MEGRFYVNKALEKLMFDELRNACRSDGIGGFLPAVRQVGNVAALPAIVNVRKFWNFEEGFKSLFHS